MSQVRCPVCGGRPARIYKCNHCDEIRCGQNDCTGSRSGIKGWASAGSQCRNCNSGRYIQISFFAGEMDDLLRQHKQERELMKKR
ncbi:hypothetical protein [Magnetofaba australis]|uniref:Uncharacterized protein n=1 Tax=Magnetofaba australis IT-1 TaxID=1434232 RepID=A0A1Y2K7E4_9PROT|nr:hypothetical protein [Magnetofaba australis]OSM04381.1 hypothetical protein MAIT1_04284 [Magnetofaba australis IT-1]